MMPVEIRELMIKATLSDPPHFSGEASRWVEEVNTEDPILPERQDHDPRGRRFIAAQLEQLLPEQVEKLLRDRFSEQALTDQIVHILARMKER
ncbi:DUF5908 family protein [Candidatus Regiella insecticola]|uniref:Uncharacterized protein n=1 Tax=Candidatus Regiella insecticola TaxID=138073 RepID=A0A6L2ZPC5_9ENTR|nr:hypothetical protein [Candidatus Regiella insecticola]GFN46422.1 hypothetical protein RINTU1_20270 [Candidatus Regiella insecticola]